MAQVKRLGYGLQALKLLAEQNRHMNSSELATALHCEPTALRKVLSQLAEQGLLDVRQGRCGGYKLSVPPDDIPLSAIYLAVKDEAAEWQGMLDTLKVNVSSERVESVFKQVLSEINHALEQKLRDYTIADLLD